MNDTLIMETKDIIRKTENVFLGREANGNLRLGVYGKESTIIKNVNPSSIPFDFLAMTEEEFEDIVASYVLSR